MGALSPTHWAIIIVLVLLLFGSRKLPDLARGVGQSLRIFKAETTDLRGEGEKSSEDQTPAVEKGSSSGEIPTSGSNGSGSAPTQPSAGSSSSGSTSSESTGSAAGPAAGSSSTGERVADSR